MPQLEQVLALAQLYHRCSICAAELLIGVGLGRKVRQLLRREVGQELAENERRAALVIALRKRFPIRVGKRGKRGQYRPPSGAIPLAMAYAAETLRSLFLVLT